LEPLQGRGSRLLSGFKRHARHQTRRVLGGSDAENHLDRSVDQFVVDLGHSKIAVVDPDGLDRLVPGYRAPVASFLAGFTVETADLNQTRTFLASQEVGFHESDGRLIVLPSAGCGSAVMFTVRDERVRRHRRHASVASCPFGDES